LTHGGMQSFYHLEFCNEPDKSSTVDPHYSQQYPCEGFVHQNPPIDEELTEEEQ